VALGKRDFVRDGDVEVTVVVENESDAPVQIAAQVLGSPQLLLEVRDAAGAVVHTVPPPTPTGEMRTLGAHEKVESKMRLGVFSPPLRAGQYTVAVRAGDPFRASAPVPFRITGSP
jgi:hypothetical protein